MGGLRALLGSRWTRERFAKSRKPPDVIHPKPRIEPLRPVVRIHAEKHQAALRGQLKSSRDHGARIAAPAMFWDGRDALDLRDVVDPVDVAVRDHDALDDDGEMRGGHATGHAFLLLTNLGYRIRRGPRLGGQ